MIFNDKIYSPYYIKASNGVNAGFIISVLFCSKIESIERQIIYIFYMCNIIPHDFLKNNREKLDKEFLLKLIFELSANKKYVKKRELRELTGFKYREPFNKHFDKHIKSLGLSDDRFFTLSETFQILQFWQGDDKWGRMEAYTKGELSKRFMNGNYEELEKVMTDNKIFDYDTYKDYRFIKPADAKEFMKKVLDKESLKSIYEEEFYIDYLDYFFIIYLLCAFKSNKKKALN